MMPPHEPPPCQRSRPPAPGDHAAAAQRLERRSGGMQARPFLHPIRVLHCMLVGYGDSKALEKLITRDTAARRCRLTTSL